MSDKSKQSVTLTTLETAVIWARDFKLTLSVDYDLDRNGDRQFIAMLRPWKQDKERPYMWWACAPDLEEAIRIAIEKCCGKNKHQDLNFGYRPWNPTGTASGAERLSPFAS